MCSASVICRGCPCTESETRQIFDTSDLEGEDRIQEHLVEIWARLSGRWIENPEEYLGSLCHLQDYGTESVVYFDIINQFVYKLISLKHYNVLRLALDRIIIHNAIFPETRLKVIGFTKDHKGDFVVVVQQPYVVGEPITQEERVSFMYDLVFEDAGMDYGMHLNYRSPDLYICDLNEFNALKGRYGLHVIDADCRLNVPEIECGGTYSYKHPIIDFSNLYYRWKEYLG